MRIRYDYVLVEPIETDAGFYIDKDYEKNKHAPVLGKVVALPEKLRFKGRELAQKIACKFRPRRARAEILHINATTLEYDTQMELEVGDVVIMGFLSHSNAMDNKFTYGNNILVRYDDLILAKRDGEILPLNGRVIVRPIYEPQDVFLGHTRSATKGEVIAIGRPLGGYQYYPKHIEEDDILVGDIVSFRKTAAIPIEFGIYQTLGEELYYMNRLNVLCTHPNHT